MKALHPILLLCSVLCLFTACQKETDMTLVQKTVFEDSNLRQIHIDDGWQVTLVYDSLHSFVQLEYSAYLEEYVSAEASNDGLTIGFNNTFYKQIGTVYKATIHTSERQRLSLQADNASNVTFEGSFELEEAVDIALRHASLCSGLSVAVPSCSILLEQASQLLGVHYQGTSCSVYAHEASSCKGYFEVGQTFDAGAYGRSQLIVFGGMMETASIEADEAGAINMVQAEANNLQVHLDGKSEATVNVGENLVGSILSASTLYYKGFPYIDVECSDDSQLIPL